MLGLFTAAYPQVTITEAMAVLWAEEFAGMDPEIGLTAARRIIREDHRFPSIARVYEMAKACVPSEVVRALPPGPPSPELTDAAAAALKAMKTALKRADSL